jgi:predicted  nucleic acid-binding Zn-ribbon protein
LQRKPKRYLIISCDRCGELTLATSTSASRTCPSCGRRQRVSARPPLASSGSPAEIRKILGEIKLRRRGLGAARHKDLRRHPSRPDDEDCRA